MLRSTSSSPPPSRSRRWTLLCLVAVSTSWAAPCANGQQVQAVGDLRVEAEPGSSFTFVYRVVDSTPRSLELTPEITEPAGWSILTGKAGFVLHQGGTDIRLVSFSVPPTAAAGEYVLAYGLRSDDGGAAASAEARHVVIAARSRLSLDVLEHPTQVLATDSYEAQVRLVNQSNLSHSVKLELSESVELPLAWGPSEVQLPAQESAVIRIRVEPPAELSKELLHQLALTARAEADPAVIATASIETTVLPTIATSPVRWHRLAGQLSRRPRSISSSVISTRPHRV